MKRLYEAFYMEHPKEDEETVKAYLEERVIPKLKEMGLYGVIIGKAYYAGTIDLAQAVADGGSQANP